MAGHSREVWRDAAGTEIMESFGIVGMGHGTPLAVGEGDMEGGAAGAFMLDVGISSTHHIARFFGLTEENSESVPVHREVAARAAPASGGPEPLDGEVLPPSPEKKAQGASFDSEKFGIPGSLPPQVLKVIQNAFEAAGLVKR